MKDNLKLRGDFLLIREVNGNDKIEGTNLTMKYDDNSHFIVAEIVEVSNELALEYTRYYPTLTKTMDTVALLKKYKPGAKVILQRIAKVPYKDGLYFASFKDILAFIDEDDSIKENESFTQLKLFESQV